MSAPPADDERRRPSSSGPLDVDGLDRSVHSGRCVDGLDRSVHGRDSSVHSGRRSVAPAPDVERGPGAGVPHPPRPLVRVETEDPVKGMPPAAALRHAVRKARGGQDVALPPPRPVDAAVTTVGAFLGIAAVAGVDAALHAPHSVLRAPALLASFGASAVLVFGVVESKLSQPPNFVVGQTLSALVGVTVGHACAAAPHWVAAATGVAAATLAMAAASVTHPPGGATALIAATRAAGPALPAAGYSLVLTVFLGALAMLGVALVVNNAHPGRRYPTYWVGRWALP